MSRRLKGVAGSLILALTCGTLGAVIPASAAQAAPLANASSPSSTGSDASLSGLYLWGDGGSDLGPSFDPAVHDYQFVTGDHHQVGVRPAVTDAGATAVVSRDGSTYALNDGEALVPVDRGRNDLEIKVTGTDGTSTETYRVAVWRDAAPTPRIVSVADPEVSAFGGDRVTVTVANGTLPYGCYISPYVGNRNAQTVDSTFDKDTGLTKLVLHVPASPGHAAGVADLKLESNCWNYSGYSNPTSRSTAPDAITYVDDFTVDSAAVPAKVSMASKIVLRGRGINTAGDVRYFIEDANGQAIRLQPTRWSGDDTAALFVPYTTDERYLGAGTRTLHARLCVDEWFGDGWYEHDGFPDFEMGDGPAECRSLWSKTVTWAPPAPADVSFSPTAGGVAGGTKVRLQGRFLASGVEQLTIKVGSKTVSGYEVRSAAQWAKGGDLDSYLSGLDVVEFVTPAGVAGPVQISAVTAYGTTVARGTFTYAAKPAITKLTPTRVANTGGSVVTVEGTSFGTSGRPTVIIGGVKSPYVTRISDRKLTAVVPALPDTTGAVDLTVSSPQGGGMSAPVALTLAAKTTAPTVTKVVPAAGIPGTEVTITGTGFGAAGTVGVSVDGVWARVVGSTATSVTFEVPTTDTPGAKDLVVASTTGLVTRAGGFTVRPEAGVTSVTPATVPSYATGNAATITLVGDGFGASGTVKVGSAAAKPYTATANGTTIEGVVVPTAAAGALSVVVTPAGSSTPLYATVRVTGPQISYVGSEPRSDAYADTNTGVADSTLVYDASSGGGTTVRVEGAGFGDLGVVTVGSTPAPVVSWSDTAIVVTAPAGAEGLTALTVTPAGSTLSASRAKALRYVAAAGLPAIGRIYSTVDLHHYNRNEFDSLNDESNEFTLTGANLAGISSAATRVTVAQQYGGESFDVQPDSITDGQLTFRAPRDFTQGGWKSVTVTTDVGTALASNGIYYVNYLTFGVSQPYGQCVPTPLSGGGGVAHEPAVLTLTNNATAFGASGTVTLDGVTVTPTSYTAGSVTITMANLGAELEKPWGAKKIVVTPDDTSKKPREFDFACSVPLTVATTANGSASDLSIPAGTDYTLGATTTGLLDGDTFQAADPAGYEYVNAAQHGSDFRYAQPGKPVAAGDYYVRVAAHAATFDRDRYVVTQTAPVRVTLTGTAVTITPVSTNGATFTYKGQLGDGTNGSTADFSYETTPISHPITKVVWEYRNSACPDHGWTEGLPRNVALGGGWWCSGNSTTRTSWDVRVKSFEMKDENGNDRALLYLPTYQALRITIEPKGVTASAGRADKVYDGTTKAIVGGIELDGVLEGDSLNVANTLDGASFASATAGVDKPVTLTSDLVLQGAWNNYTLTNPRPTVVGTIAPADARLELGVSARSVVLSGVKTVTVTPTVRNASTFVVQAPADGAAAVVLSSDTPTVCTVSGTTVTAKAAGTCVVTGSQAASTNYKAAMAASDPSSTEEKVEIQVFPATRAITVVADDVTFSIDDVVEPTVQVNGLFDGDEVTGVQFDVYKGATLLPGIPSEVGTYKIVPKGGSLQAANLDAYSNASEFRYVAGTLVITGLPPVIDTVSPTSGPVAGGTLVTITGKRLDTVKSVRIGDATLRRPSFTVNETGTRLTFRTPKATVGGLTTITMAAGTATAEAPFTYVGVVPTPAPVKPAPVKPAPVKPAPVKLNLNLDLKLETKVAGAKAGLSGSGLKPKSAFVLEMHSKVVVLARGTTDAKGAFNKKLTLPKKACIKGGLHELVLKGTSPAGKVIRDVKWVAFDDTCTTRGVSDTKPTSKKPLVTKWFIFDHLSAKLSPEARKSLKALAPSLRGAKKVTIIGYTQTQNQSAASIKANKKLALKRAQAVKSYLRSVGVKARIDTVGRGPVDPVSKKKQHLNRRVVVDVRY